MPIIDAAGTRLNYETLGDDAAPSVLLIMGASAPMTRWPERFCQAIAEAGFRVLRFDNRDAGASEKLDCLGLPVRGSLPPYRLEDMGEDAIGLLTHLGIERAHVVGVSMGGAIAQLIAIQHPDRVLTLTSMMSTTSARDLAPGSERVRALFSSAPRAALGMPESGEGRLQALLISAEAGRSPGFPMEPASVRQRAEREVAGGFTLAGRARQAGALVAARDRSGELNSVTAATLVIHGDADELFPLEHGRATAAAVPGSRLVVVPGLGHDLPSGAEELLASLLIAHFRMSPERRMELQ